MEQLKQRIDQLELRVQELEEKLQSMNQPQRELPKRGVTYLENQDYFFKKKYKPASIYRNKKAEGDKGLDSHTLFDKEMPSWIEKFKDKESLIGKYFIGALASLLIFIAAISFVAMVWNDISSEIKLGVVSLIGLVLSGVGFTMALKKPSNVSSVVFGTGIGLVYIAIVSANLVFSLVSHEISALLCVAWTLLILYSHRYTKLYFTIVVASIGSFINLAFELTYVSNLQDMLFIVGYTSLVSVMLLYVSNMLDKVRNAISIAFVFFNFALLFKWMHDVASLDYAWAQVIVTVALVLIVNWIYSLANKENLHKSYLVLTVISIYCLLFTVTDTLRGPDVLGLSSLQVAMIGFILIFVQCIINQKVYPNIESSLTKVYVFPLYFLMVEINSLVFSEGAMGAVAILLYVIVRKHVWAKGGLGPYTMVFILLDFIVGLKQTSMLTMVFTIVNMALLFYIFYQEQVESLLYKNVALAMLFVSYFKVSYDLSVLAGWNVYLYDMKNLIAYGLSVITLIVVYYIGYLEPKEQDVMRFHPHFGVYLFSILLYVFGLKEMLLVEDGIIRFIITLTTFSVLVFKSYVLIKDYQEMPNHIGIWFVTKYFIFVWTMIHAFWRLPFDSVSYSVVGLVLAIASIYIGFKYGIKIIRQYGLGLAMLMVVKFIFVDLQGENSITRVVAFTIGGILCFIISIIYNRLSKEE